MTEPLPPPMITPRNYIRTLLFGYAVASVVVLLTNLDRASSFGRLLVFVLVIGFVINTTIWGFIVLFRPVIQRLPERRHLPVYAFLTLASGLVGFPIGYAASGLILFGRLPSLGSFKEPFAITLGVSLLAGIAMHAYLQLEQRFIASLERMKVHELAEQELKLARAIQQRLLPPGELHDAGWSISARNVPARFVAGDFYDAFPLPDGRIALFIGDVSGKGIGASLIMASVKSVLPLLARSGDVANTLLALHEKLQGELGPREFVAVAHAVFDPRTGQFTLANAALPDPYLVTSAGALSPIVVPGKRLPLGLESADRSAYSTRTVTLAPGDAVLFFTDGLPEARDEAGEPFGYDRVQTLVQSLAEENELTPGKLIAALPQAAAEDDVTLMILRRR